MRSSIYVRCVLLLGVALLAWRASDWATSAAQQNEKPVVSQPPTGDQQSGSILIYNYYQSNLSSPDTDTVITLTNSHPEQLVSVHLFFVHNTGCKVTDKYVCLAGKQTFTFNTSDFDPNGGGYIVAVAVDAKTGVPVGHNFLSGAAQIKNPKGYNGALPAVAIAANFDGALPETARKESVAVLDFNGAQGGYAQLPRVLQFDGLTSQADGNSTQLVVNRMGGNLAEQMGTLGALAGTLRSDAGASYSFTRRADSCQMQSSLSELVSGVERAIPTRRTGTISLGAAEGEIGLLGAVLNANRQNLSLAGANNFKAESLTAKNSLVVPISAPPQACTFALGPGADLRMDMTANPPLTVVRGANITYTLTATNEGFDPAFNVVIRDSLPATLTFVDAVPSSGGSCFVPPQGSPGTVTCTFAGTSGLLVQRSVTIVAQALDTLPAGTEIVNTGETYSDVNDPNPSNNARTLRIYATAVSNEMVITTNALPTGRVGDPYSYALTVVNGAPTYTWSIVGGALPQGMFLTPAGVVSGTPTEAGTFNFRVRVQDSNFNITEKNLSVRTVTQFRAVKSDFDGDGRTDLSVWRGYNTEWVIQRSSDSSALTVSWGASYAPYFDKPVAADYDGDGKTDIAVWRPNEGNWYIRNSGNGSVRVEQWGQAGDTPVPGDYDGDGKADLAVWRGSVSLWSIKQSSNGQEKQIVWGASYAPYFDTPVPADYDGDGKTDAAVWRGNTTAWYILRSSDSGVQQVSWGSSNAPYFDVPVPADYDGDGKADVAVWRGNTTIWYIRRSQTNNPLEVSWGASYDPYNDVPTPGDYDGDGRTDVAVWRSSLADWYVIRSGSGTVLYQNWGLPGDTPIPR